MSANFTVAPAHLRSTAAIRRAGRGSAKRVVARGVRAEAVKEQKITLNTTKSDMVRLPSLDALRAQRARLFARASPHSRHASTRVADRRQVPGFSFFVSSERICIGYQSLTTSRVE
jgi:hypothetical protein